MPIAVALRARWPILEHRWLARESTSRAERRNQLQEVVKSHVRQWTTAITVLADGIWLHGDERLQAVESRCGAVAVGSVCLLPPLSSGGARVTLP